MSISIFKKAIVAAALSIGLAGAANAEVINFNYGTETIATLTTSGGTTFVLDFKAAPDSGAFINDLFLIGPAGTFSAPGGQGTSAVVSYSATGLGDANAYNWKLDFPQPNNANRFKAGESYTWSISGTNPDVWDLSMLHINAFLYGQSIKLKGTTEVPEPATLGLLGLGLVGAGIARRRRSK